MPDNRIVEDSYVALVLILAKKIKDEMAEHGTRTTSDCIEDAVKAIAKNRSRIAKMRSSD